jgi:iron complex outermembrane receptor protein
MNNSAVRGLLVGRVSSACLLLLLTSALLRSPPRALAADPEPAAQPPADLLDLSLTELVKIPIPKVYGASKWEQPTTLAPSSVTVITAEEIKKYGHRTLADVLASVRGLHVTYDRNYSFLGTRGVNRGDYNNRVLVLVDGHRINNNISDGGFIGTEFILDVDLIDQVEVIRGPVATLYGNNAFFGIINVTTRRGGSLKGVGGEASVEAGTFDAYKGRATWGHKFGDDLEMLFSGSIYDSHGPGKLFFKDFNSPATNNGLAEDADDDSYQSAFGSVRWRDFTLQGAFITREKGNPTAQYFLAFNDRRHRTIEDRGYADLSFRHDFPEVAEVFAKIYYDRYDFTRDQPPAVPGVPLFREAQSGEWWGSELQLTRELFDRHTLILGAEYRDDFRQQRRSAAVGDPTFPVAFDQRDTFNYGVFFQGDFAVLTNLHFNAGVRYDQYGDNDPTANPRLALIWNPAPKSTVKATYGTAFRAPNYFERIFNQALDPETIQTLELAYEQEIGDHLRSSASLFANRIDDLISLEPDPAGGSSYQNIKGADAQGVEVELEGFWASGLRGRVSYTFTEAEDRRDGSWLTDSPKHLAKLNLSAPVVKDKLFADFEVQYTSGRRTLVGTDAGGFGIVNFTLFSQNLLKGLDLSASVYNLLDREYRDPATLFHQQALIERDGRTFRVKTTYRF